MPLHAQYHVDICAHVILALIAGVNGTLINVMENNGWVISFGKLWFSVTLAAAVVCQLVAFIVPRKHLISLHAPFIYFYLALLPAVPSPHPYSITGMHPKIFQRPQTH